MFENTQNYPMELGAKTGAFRPPSVLERLTDEKARCEARLTEVNNALALLAESPGITAVLEALSKIGF